MKVTGPNRQRETHASQETSVPEVATAPVTTGEQARPKRRTWRVVLMTVLAVVVGGVLVAPYLGLDPAGSRIELREGVVAHWPLLLTHIFAGAVALVTGALQFLPALRRRPRTHRTLGRVYLGLGVLPASIASLFAAVVTVSGLSTRVSMLFAGTLWIITGWYAYRAARAGRFAAHREWMIRNYAVTFLAVTARLWVPLLIVAQLPALGSTPGGVEALAETAIPVGQWASWVGNLIVAEVVINRSRAHRQAVTG